MPHQEKILRRETLSRGRVFTHERWQVRLENGGTAEREMILHPGGVGIVAIDEQGRLLMVRQYRSGAGAETLEIPAGKRDPGETGAGGGVRTYCRAAGAADGAVPHPRLLQRKDMGLCRAGADPRHLPSR